MEIFIINLINIFALVVFIIILSYVLDFKTVVINGFRATGLPLVLAKSKFTIGFPMFKNKIVFGGCEVPVDTDFKFESNLSKSQSMKEFKNKLIGVLSEKNSDVLDSVANSKIKTMEGYYNHAHVSRWFETEFAKGLVSQNFTSGKPKGSLYMYNNFGDLPYNVGKFDLKMLGSGTEGVSLNCKTWQYIMNNNSVSIDCNMFNRNYDFRCLTEEELFDLKINLDFIKRYLPDIMNDLEVKYGKFIKILENSKDITEFNSMIVEFNRTNTNSYIVNIAQMPESSESLGFCEIPVEHVLEIANSVVNNII